jgi:hypothetical protein
MFLRVIQNTTLQNLQDDLFIDIGAASLTITLPDPRTWNADKKIILQTILSNGVGANNTVVQGPTINRQLQLVNNLASYTIGNMATFNVVGGAWVTTSEY